jgi:hypothetical protein
VLSISALGGDSWDTCRLNPLALVMTHNARVMACWNMIAYVRLMLSPGGRMHFLCVIRRTRIPALLVRVQGL